MKKIVIILIVLGIFLPKVNHKTITIECRDGRIATVHYFVENGVVYGTALEIGGEKCS